MSSGWTRGPPCMEIVLRPPGQARWQAAAHIIQNLSSARIRMGWTTWWLWRGACTRSHPELGRENPQRPWYCVSRRGRVGRRQVFQPIRYVARRSKSGAGRRLRLRHVPATNVTGAGWSSPVARQAHNLKAAGSNPAPATIHPTNHPARPVQKRGLRCDVTIST
jgi:hypothetical protein